MDYESLRSKGFVSFEEISPKSLKNHWNITSLPEKSRKKQKHLQSQIAKAKNTGISSNRKWENFPEISKKILEVLKRFKFDYPTEIQYNVLLESSYNNSINFIISPTGTGKTLAILIPILQTIIESQNCPLFSFLIVSPTADLAFQLKDYCERLAKALDLSIKLSALTGGIFSEKQSRIIKNGVHILVVTPGMLKNLINSSIDFSNLKFVVFDEADRSLDPLQTSFKDINSSMKKIFKSIKSIRDLGVSFVSALLDPVQIKEKTFLSTAAIASKNTNFISTSSKNSHEISDYIIHVLDEDKPALLFSMVDLKRYRKIIVFVNSLACVKKLKIIANALRLKVDQLDSTRRMGKRVKVLKKSASSECCVCLSTDLSSRGIDFKDFDCVIQYDQPSDLGQFVHRRGRTGRSCTGFNYLFSSPKDSRSLENLLLRNYSFKEDFINSDQIVAYRVKINNLDNKILNDSMSESSEFRKFAEELGYCDYEQFS